LTGAVGEPDHAGADVEGDCGFIRLIFAYYGGMFQGPANRKQFVVTCKRCRRDVPSAVREFPFQSIEVTCCLCGEGRRYLPSEIFLGRVDHLVVHQWREKG
jgi:hypothetical protein